MAGQGRVSWWRETAGRIKTELAVYQAVIRHPQTPRISKWLLGLAVAYILMPFDLIPDFIPVLGQLDELVLVPLLVMVSIKLIPREVMTECRKQVISASN